jgi:hypothetical protein
MKFFLRCLFTLLLAYPAVCDAAGTESLLAVLKAEISKKNIYDGQKQSRIKQLKHLQQTTSNSDNIRQYDICLKLYDEYKSYQYDSAYVYVNKLKNISLALKDVQRIYYCQIKLVFIIL